MDSANIYSQFSKLNIIWQFNRSAKHQIIWHPSPTVHIFTRHIDGCTANSIFGQQQKHHRARNISLEPQKEAQTLHWRNRKRGYNLKHKHNDTVHFKQQESPKNYIFTNWMVIFIPIVILTVSPWFHIRWHCTSHAIQELVCKSKTPKLLYSIFTSN